MDYRIQFNYPGIQQEEKMANKKTAGIHYGWVVVIGACLCNFLLVGMSRSMGIFYSSVRLFFRESAAASATFLSIYNTLRMVLGPLASILCEKWGCRPVVMLGGLLFSLGFILSSVAVNLIYLNFSFGVVCGVGGAFIFTPPYIIVGKYFEKKKGQAMSLSTIGAGIGTISLAPLVSLLLGYYGTFGAWLITGGIMLNICVAGALFRPKNTQLEDVNCTDNIEKRPLNSREVSPSLKDVQSSATTPHNASLSGLNNAMLVRSGAKTSTVNCARPFESVPTHGGLNDSTLTSKSTSHIDNVGFSASHPSAPLSHPHLMRVRSNTTSSAVTGDRIPKKSANRTRTYSESAQSQQSLTCANEYVRKLKKAEMYSSMDRISIHPHDDDLWKELEDEEQERCRNRANNPEVNVAKSNSKNSSNRSGSEFLRLISNLSFIVYLINVATMPFCLMTALIYLPSLAIEIGVPNESSVGLLLSLTGFADVIGRFTSGFIFDLKAIRVPKRRRLVFGIVGLLFSLSTLLIGLCPNFTLLLICSFIYGILEGAYHSQRMTILSELLTPVEIASAVGWSIFAQGTGNLMSAPLAGYLKDVFGTFRCGYYFGAAIFSAASGLLIMDNFWQTRNLKTTGLELINVINVQSSDDQEKL